MCQSKSNLTRPNFPNYHPAPRCLRSLRSMWGLTVALLDECDTPRPNCRPCANLDHGRHSANYSARRLGCGYGANVASIMRRWRAQSPLSDGGRTLQATNCVSERVALVAAQKAQRSSGQAGPAITSALSRFRQASAWRMIAIDQGGGKRRCIMSCDPGRTDC